MVNIKENSILRNRDILSSYYALRKTGLFSSLDIKPIWGEEKEYADIVISLRDRRYKYIGFGLGYSNIEGIKTIFDFGNKNLFRRGGRLSFNGFYSKVQKGGRFRLFFPFLYEKINFYSKAEYLEAKTSVYKALFGRGSITFSREFLYKIRFNVRLSFDRIWLVDNTLGLSEDLLPDRLETFLYYIYLFRDSRDNIFLPKKGDFSEFGIGYIEYNKAYYFRFIYEVYIKLFNFLVFACRNYLESYLRDGVVPAYYRFFIATSNSLRGYKYHSFGPMLSGAYIGGESLYALSFEYRFYMKNIGFVLFMDLGWISFYELFRSHIYFSYSPGVGFRYLTPIGPLRIDLGFERFYWKRANVYFGFGEAF